MRVTLGLQVIELALEVATVTRTLQLHLDVRRVCRRVAILVLAETDRRRVEGRDHVTLHVTLEPQLGVLHTLINHVLVQRMQSIEE